MKPMAVFLFFLLTFFGTSSFAGAFPADMIVLEAENPFRAERGASVIDDREASGGQAVDVPAQVKAFYSLTIPSSGRWYVWVRMYAKNPNADSVWVGSDDGLPSPADNSRPDRALRFYAAPADSVRAENSLQVWYWDSGTAKADPRASITFFQSGEATVWIKGRETGTLIDTILLTQDESFDPETELRGGPITRGMAEVAKAPPKAREPVALGTEFPLWKPWPATPSTLAIPTEEFRETILEPSLCAFVPEDGQGAAVLILPGGGYRKLVYQTEGIAIARWLHENKIAAFVLSYRLPPEGNRTRIEEAAADTRQALQLIRDHAQAWGIQPDRVGVIGFSAGAHLAASVGLADPSASALRFLALIYPALPSPAAVSRHAPETFLVASRVDSYVSSGEVVGLYQRLQAAGIPSEIHVFSTGPRGFGVSPTGTNIDHWKELVLGWMRDMRVIP